jgi:hypothetical protein
MASPRLARDAYIKDNPPVINIKKEDYPLQRNEGGYRKDELF